MEHPELDSPFEGKYLYRKKYHIHHILLLFWQPTFGSNMSSYFSLLSFSIAFILQAFKHRPSGATIIRNKFISTNRKFQSPPTKMLLLFDINYCHSSIKVNPCLSIIFTIISCARKIGCLRFNELSSPSYVSYY